MISALEQVGGQWILLSIEPEIGKGEVIPFACFVKEQCQVNQLLKFPIDDDSSIAQNGFPQLRFEKQRYPYWRKLRALWHILVPDD